MYSLSLFLKEDTFIKYKLEKSYTIGRSISRDFRLNFPFISRCHCTLILMPDDRENDKPYYLLKDGHILGEPSANGTWVNGQRVRGLYQVKPQDVITFGNSEIYPYALFLFDCVNTDEELESKATSGHERTII